MVSVTPTTPSTTTPADPVAAQSVTDATAAVQLFLKSKDVLQSLSDQSSQYLPVTNTKIFSTVWALLDPNRNSSLTKADVVKAVLQKGGSSASADALWAQLDPKKIGIVAAGDFVTNTFIGKVVSANLKTVKAAVTKLDLQNAAAPANFLDTFASGGGVLDLFA